jgi:hypothetical protein
VSAPVLQSANALVEAIDAIGQANRALVALAAEQRKAISKMRSYEVGAIVARQREVGRELANAEEKRRAAVVKLCAALGLPPSAALADVARAVGAHDRATGQAISEAADRARRAILECQSAHRVVHAAATGVVAHLDGLARQVLARVNRAGVYAASGALAGGATPRGVDLVS